MDEVSVSDANILQCFRLDGRVAVVTGGGTGIGRAIAHGLSDVGADVVVAGRRLGPLEHVAAEIAGRGRRALAITADVTSEAAMTELAEAAASFGPLWVWVNNAGGVAG